MAHRFGPHFPRLFVAALLEGVAFTLLVHLPGYFTELGASEGMIGILYASAAVVALISRPGLGRILDLTRRRSVILVAAAGEVLVILGLMTTQAWNPYLWVIFLAQRLLNVAVFTTFLVYAADLIPVERRTQGLAIFGLSGLLPIAAGGYLGDVVIATFGFDGLFVASAAALLSSWLIVWTLPVLPIRGIQPRRSFWSALAEPSLLPLWLLTLMFSIGLESLFTFTRTYVDATGIGTTGLFFGVYGLSAAATRIFGGSRYDRLSHRILAVAAVTLFGVGLGTMASADSVWALAVAGLLSGAAHGAVFPVLSSQVVNRARISERGSAMATFTSVFDISGLVGTPVVGLLIDRWGYQGAFSTAGVVVIVGAVAYGLWDRRLPYSAQLAEELSQ
ncbi:MAG: MFS transporter [Acidimicrobiia bacterium]